jgi:hypothetical protein
MDEKTIQKAKKFSEVRKAEKELRDLIADIAAKLNRSNLSAKEGKEHAETLVDAYALLAEWDVSKHLKEFI